MRFDGFDMVVHDLKDAVVDASACDDIGDADLRDVLSFLTKVVQVVDQSFQDVYTFAVELSLLREEDLNSDRFRRLEANVELITASSHYRNSLEVCSRLRHLHERFDEFISPAIGKLSNRDSWRQLFWLIEDREGRIIELVERATDDLRTELRHAKTGGFDGVRERARGIADQLRPLLGELRELTNQTLGLSGRIGFIELTRDRSELGRAVNLVVNQGAIHMTRDVFITEKAGAVGPNSTATNTTFNEFHGDPLAGLDRAALLTELATLRCAMQAKAAGSAQYASLSAISEAEDAAKQGDSTTLMSKLKAAGSWAWDTATKIGVSVAAEAIKKASGLG